MSARILAPMLGNFPWHLYSHFPHKAMHHDRTLSLLSFSAAWYLRRIVDSEHATLDEYMVLNFLRVGLFLSLFELIYPSYRCK